MIGLFPANYVEVNLFALQTFQYFTTDVLICNPTVLGFFQVINKEVTSHAQAPQMQRSKPSEGQARAKYNFQAQSGVELSLNKGELVALTRRVDDNWFEGRIANRKGIFPVSYVEVS